MKDNQKTRRPRTIHRIESPAGMRSLVSERKLREGDIVRCFSEGEKRYDCIEVVESVAEDGTVRTIDRIEDGRGYSILKYPSKRNEMTVEDAAYFENEAETPEGREKARQYRAKLIEAEEAVRLTEVAQ